MALASLKIWFKCRKIIAGGVGWGAHSIYIKDLICWRSTFPLNMNVVEGVNHNHMYGKGRTCSTRLVDKKNYQTVNNNAEQIKLRYNFIIHLLGNLGNETLNEKEVKFAYCLCIRGVLATTTFPQVTHEWSFPPSLGLFLALLVLLRFFRHYCRYYCAELKIAEKGWYEIMLLYNIFAALHGTERTEEPKVPGWLCAH